MLLNPVLDIFMSPILAIPFSFRNTSHSYPYSEYEDFRNAALPSTFHVPADSAHNHASHLVPAQIINEIGRAHV